MREEFKGNHKGTNPVEIRHRACNGVANTQLVHQPSEIQEKSFFDEVIVCVDADNALKLFQTNSWHWERKVLGNVKYLWDISVTHSDLEYMRKHYRVEYAEHLASEKRRGDEEFEKQKEFARKEFKPLYFIRSYEEDKEKVEMSFDLTNYQPQVRSPSSLPFLPY